MEKGKMEKALEGIEEDILSDIYQNLMIAPMLLIAGELNEGEFKDKLSKLLCDEVERLHHK